MIQRMKTQDEVNAYRDATRAKFSGLPFRIDSNGWGLRAECTICHTSATNNPETFIRSHATQH